jgi:hypothetical protein
MAKKESQKVKGCKKCGRSKRKNNGSVFALYVRGKITAETYFKETNQKVRK